MKTKHLIHWALALSLATASVARPKRAPVVLPPPSPSDAPLARVPVTVLPGGVAEPSPAIQQSAQPARPAASWVTRGADELPIRDTAALDHYFDMYWKAHQETPAPPATPEIWLRRVWLDLMGIIPPTSVRSAFLANSNAAARENVVAGLLASTSFAARWGRVLAQAVSGNNASPGQARGLTRLISNELAGASSWTSIVHSIMNDGISLLRTPDNEQISGQIGSGLLGIRLRCAQCHDDPVNGWKAAEFYGLSAFFGVPRRAQVPARMLEAFRAGRIQNFYQLVMVMPQTQARGPDHRWVRVEVDRAVALLNRLHKQGIGPRPPPPVTGFEWGALDIYRIHQERARQRRGENPGVYSHTTSVAIPGAIDDLRMPVIMPLPGQPAEQALRPGRIVPMRFPGSAGPAAFRGNRRVVLTQWVSDPKNPFVGRAVVNRVFAQLMKRGLVEPLDEIAHPLRATHEELLSRLAAGFAANRTDLKWLVKTIVLSRAYSAAGATPSVITTAALAQPAPTPPPLPTPEPRPTPVLVESPSVASTPPTTGTTASAATTATPGESIGSFRFPAQEGGCTRAEEHELPASRDRDWTSAPLRALDPIQVTSALCQAAGQPLAAVTSKLRQEVDESLELWATLSASGSVSSLAELPPLQLTEAPQLDTFLKTAPVLRTLEKLPDGTRRLEQLFVQVLSREPLPAERTRLLDTNPGPGPASWSPAQEEAWVQILHQLVNSAEFLTNH